MPERKAGGKRHTPCCWPRQSISTVVTPGANQPHVMRSAWRSTKEEPIDQMTSQTGEKARATRPRHLTLSSGESASAQPPVPQGGGVSSARSESKRARCQPPKANAESSAAETPPRSAAEGTPRSVCAGTSSNALSW
uniref:Uncharacterized protein n=1 Tax=Emiliania huxleyi TaxID=2903 RepID=A0A7S3SJX4_EMIHU